MIFGRHIQRERRARKKSLRWFAHHMGWTVDKLREREQSNHWSRKERTLAIKLLTRREDWPD